MDALMNDVASPMNVGMMKTMRRELTAMLTKQHEATGHMHLPNTRTVDASKTSGDASKLAEVFQRLLEEPVKTDPQSTMSRAISVLSYHSLPISPLPLMYRLRGAWADISIVGFSGTDCVRRRRWRGRCAGLRPDGLPEREHRPGGH